MSSTFVNCTAMHSATAGFRAADAGKIVVVHGVYRPRPFWRWLLNIGPNETERMLIRKSAYFRVADVRSIGITLH